MTEHIQAMVQRFKLMVPEDDHTVRRAMCFALTSAMEKAIARAADNDDRQAMAEARAFGTGPF